MTDKSKQQFVCFLDADGVITDWIGGMLRSHNVYINPYKNSQNWGNPKFEEVLGMNSVIMWSVADSYWWANLNPTEYFYRIMSILENYFGPNNICLLTSPTKNKDERIAPEAAHGKIKWINKWLPSYRDQFLIGYHKEFAAAPNKILVDDSDDKCNKFRDAGGKAILFPQRWNSAYAETDRCVEVLEEKVKEILDGKSSIH